MIGKKAWKNLTSTSDFRCFVTDYYNHYYNKNSAPASPVTDAKSKDLQYDEISSLIFKTYTGGSNATITGTYGPRWLLDYVLFQENNAYYTTVHYLLEAVDGSDETIESLTLKLQQKSKQIESLNAKLDKTNELLKQQNDMIKEQTKIMREQRERIESLNSKLDDQKLYMTNWMNELTKTVTDSTSMKAFKPLFEKLQSSLCEEFDIEIQKQIKQLIDILQELHPDATQVWFNRSYRKIYTDNGKVTCDVLKSSDERHELTEAEIRKLKFK